MGVGFDEAQAETLIETVGEAHDAVASKGDLEALGQQTKADLEAFGQQTKADLEALRQQTNAGFLALEHAINERATKADLQALEQSTEAKLRELETTHDDAAGHDDICRIRLDNCDSEAIPVTDRPCEQCFRSSLFLAPH